MSVFKIKGGKKLKGEIIPQGAKNEALQILSATILSAEPVTIHNVPNIVDVNKLIELIGDLGCKVEKLGPESYRFTASNVNTKFLETEEYRKKAAAFAAPLCYWVRSWHALEKQPCRNPVVIKSEEEDWIRTF